MGRFKYDEVDHYGGQGGAGYFSLKDDKDVAQVRFMYRDIEDVSGYAVHEVQVDGRKRYVNCLREYGEPVDNCPFCKAGHFQTARLFIPLYNIDQDKVQIWERGKKFFGQISSLASRYPNLCSHVFEIERNGKKGETSTTYGIYEINSDNTRLEDLPEVPEILGGVVLDKSFDELQCYIDTGSFPSDVDNKVDRVIPRRGEREEVRRRTPADSNRRDSF